MKESEHSVRYEDIDEFFEDVGLTDRGELAQARRHLESYVHGWHLAQLRKSRGRTQRQMADQMSVSQPRVHEVEHGDLDKTTLAVLRSYVEALGGELEVVAKIDGAVYRVA
ncbi:XRE family transcriptional regulator [Sphaerisporangium sp. NPDC004334]